jgi:short-subunit dehydrogenase
MNEASFTERSFVERSFVERSFVERYGPWALVAGASEGMGSAFAHALAARGCNVVLLARRLEVLEALAADMVAAHGVEVRVASIDLTSPMLLEQLAPVVDDLEVGLVVHNAGADNNAGLFLDRPVTDALHLLDLNCRSVVLLVHRFAPHLVARGHGGFVLMSSMASVAGSGYTAGYAASKAYGRVLAEGLWLELGQHGVDVLGVPAGLTATPAAARAGILRPDTGIEAMSSEAVVAECLDALGNGPLLVPGEGNRLGAQMFWPIPQRDLVPAMTASTAALFGLPPLAAPPPRET